MIITILISVSVTLWCIVSFALYGYHYLLEVILDLPIIGESSRTANDSALRVIIQKIIREANALPRLKIDGESATLEENNRTYENLLSAAILNKIISNSQNNISPGSSSRPHSVCSHASSSSKRRNLQNEYFYNEKTSGNKWKSIDTDTASVSSLEEWVHSDSSLGSTKYVDHVSFTIKQRIEEVTSSESEDNDVSPEENADAYYFRSDSSFGNNERNWFLQKRQFRGGTISPVPVPMLVPNPTVEAKVLIGDKEIDDTSDLSDVPSDFEDETQVAVAAMDVKKHLIGSKRIIGGKNSLIDFNLVLSDDDVSADSGVKECKDLDEMDSEVFFFGNKHKTKYSADASSTHSEGSNNERDTEYTERYATLPRQISISPKNIRSSEDCSDQGTKNYQKATKNPERKNYDGREIYLGETEDPERENEKEFTGLYSQREKQKWKHAVELKNNPYSKENIEKRIKTQNSINSLFGNDYYIKQACLPSGAKKREIEKADSIYPEATSTIEKHSQTESEEKALEQFSIENNSVTPDRSIFTHRLASDKLKYSKYTENIREVSDSELHFSSELNSDSDASLVHCYNIPQSVIYKKICDEKEEIQSAEKFLESESLEDFSNPTKKQFKPVAKPRKRLKSEKISERIAEKSATDTHSKFFFKNEDVTDGEFNSICCIMNRKSDNTLIKPSYSFNSREKCPISIEKSAIKNPSVNNTKSIIQTSMPIKENRRKKGNKDVIFPIYGLSTSASTKENTPQIPEESNIHHMNDNGKINGDDKFEYLKSENLAYNNKNNSSGGGETLEEISKLKQQKLVANRLKQFSKSFDNLSEICDDCVNENDSFSLSRENNLSTTSEDRYIGRKLSGQQKKFASVKDLRKMFEQFNVSKQEKPILYSLTGRSISKQIKEKLRDLDEQTPLSQIQSLSLTDLEVIENAEDSITKFKEN